MPKVTNLTVQNFKIHKDLNIDINKRFLLLVGDSGKGKSTIANSIRSAMTFIPFPKNPLSEGEEKGSVELVQTREDGLKFFTRRTFHKDKNGVEKVQDRYTVKDSNGGIHPKLDEVLDNLFGEGFINKYFDWDEFFNKTKSDVARTEYLLKRLPDPTIYETTVEISDLTKERTQVGKDAKQQQAVLDDLGMTPEKLEHDWKYYLQPRESSEAQAVKDVYLEENIVDIDELQAQKDIFDNIIEVSSQATKKLNEISERQAAIIKEIEALKLEQKTLSANAKSVTAALNKMDPEAGKKSAELSDQITVAKDKNTEVLKEADRLFLEEFEKIQTFNLGRQNFEGVKKTIALAAAKKKEYDELTARIAEKKESNMAIFRKSLPLPELSVSDDGVILYHGRPLTLEGNNISTGESIKIAVEIQKALNPKGSNIVFIHNAESLGSKLYQVFDICKEYDVQAIIEITEEDSELEIIVTDDAGKDLQKRAVDKAKAMLKKKPSTKKKKED